ncbi:MAG TPA: SDR family oxidoreductase [Ignavibacteria bacterium]|nr:short chain dehydrogenase [Bacteroidota bacterium]HRF66805.1 SDR family oxidoreductase [Ignavibacteria bacterium]HRJ05516.1 SDR family oxidoreductase [Ignavibacteria bacterium]
MKLLNKIAVITGAGKGIGKATAELFLKEGAKVVLTSRNKSDLEQFIAGNESKKDNITILAGDISKEETIQNVIDETIGKYGKADILVNNAGFGIFDNMVDSKTEDFDAVFNTNVRALYLITKGFLPHMIKEHSGTIINIASVAGKQGFATGTIYCASKHAVMGISRALMLEVRQYNIRVCAICPGSVATDFFRTDSQTTLSSSKESVLQAEEIAETILLAASLPENAMIDEIEIRPTNPRK